MYKDKETQERIVRYEKRERDAMTKSAKQIYEALDLSTTDRFNIIPYMTPIGSKERFDMLLHKYDDGAKVSCSIIETKIRETHFNELILEQCKYNALVKQKSISKGYNFPQIDIYYLNYTPVGTYLFKLSTNKDRYTWEYDEYNKYTAAKQQGKVSKKVTKLNIDSEFCIKLDYIYDYKEEDRGDKILVKQERLKCIFSSL